MREKQQGKETEVVKSRVSCKHTKTQNGKLISIVNLLFTSKIHRKRPLSEYT